MMEIWLVVFYYQDNVDVIGMEEVRSQLQNMLKFSSASGLGIVDQGWQVTV